MIQSHTKGFYTNQNKFNFQKNNANKEKNNYYGQKALSSNDLKGKIQYIKTIDAHVQTINNLESLNDSRYLFSVNNEFYILSLKENQENYKENLGKNTKIKKIIYISGKIILSVEYYNEVNGNDDKSIPSKLYIITNINSDKKLYFCNTKDYANDILVSENVIITAGKNNIELFEFNENNNNNPLKKVSEITFNNNDGQYKILSIINLGKILICAHNSGHISFWKPINNYPFLNNTSISRIHIGPINKIIADKNSENSDILISCSSDKTVKVHSIDTVCFNIINFNEEVVDIKKVINLNEQTNYIISLKNGIIKVYNNFFKEVMDIPSHLKTNITRYVLSINNINNDNENKDSYLLITEDNKIDIYMWIKENKTNEKVKMNYNKKKYGKNWNNRY